MYFSPPVLPCSQVDLLTPLPGCILTVFPSAALSEPTHFTHSSSSVLISRATQTPPPSKYIRLGLALWLVGIWCIVKSPATVEKAVFKTDLNNKAAHMHMFLSESWLLFVMVWVVKLQLGHGICPPGSLGCVAGNLWETPVFELGCWIWFPSKDWFWMRVIFALTPFFVPPAWMTEEIFFFYVTPCLQHHPERWTEQQNHLA